MKLIKTALFATTMALVSASAFAQIGYDSKQAVKTVSVQPTATSEAAYQKAFAELNSLKNMSSRELNKELMLVGDISATDTHLQDGSYVTVQERMNEDGKLEYLGTANVKVYYEQREVGN